MPLNISKNSVISPKLSIIIPTLNAQRVLTHCLRAIDKQKFKDYEILILDGGSTDNTLKIAKKYHAKVFKNSLKTAEAGKALGLKKASGKFVALIDSDNFLPHPNWFDNMLAPFTDKDIVGSEPICFTYRPRAGFVERYSALLGVNDPYAYFTGNYDRYSYLSDTWTGLPIKTEDKNSYLKLKIDNPALIPTIGANGTIFRKDFLQKNFSGDYLFDIDILAAAKKPLYFAKVKEGIIHTFCESSISKFIKKQQRRVTDYYTYKAHRQYQWSSANNKIIPFTLYSLLILPSLFDAIRGFIKKPDPAWFFHPFACFVTVIVYATTTIKHKLGLLKSLDRNQWRQ